MLYKLTCASQRVREKFKKGELKVIDFRSIPENLIHLVLPKYRGKAFEIQGEYK